MSDLTALDATELSDLIVNRHVSAAEVMADFLDRIDLLNPALNAIVALRDPDELMRAAAEADASPRRSWLHGLPIAVKDLVAVRGIRSTWGSPIFADFVPEADEPLAARLRQAGAVLIGKTNTPEFGLGSHSFNPVFGATRNPYDRTRTAGGSSGGAAAALAARMLPVADGSDMMGSLRNPAAFCNVYGFRPSFGLVPGKAEGETFLHMLATDGAMARSPRDLAGLLEILAQPDPRTPHNRTHGGFAAGLSATVRGRRVGWLGDWAGHYPMEPGILDLCHAALDQMEALGLHVEPISPPFDPRRLWHSWCVLRAFANAGNRRVLYDDPEKRAQLKPEALWEIEQGLPLSAMQVHDASVIRSEWYRIAARLFEDYDALIMPSAQVWPFPVDWRWPETVAGRAMDTYHRWMEVVVPVSLIGLPSLSVPIGFGPGGLPMGMQIFGPAGGDLGVLQLGEAWHQATNWPAKRPPLP